MDHKVLLVTDIILKMDTRIIFFIRTVAEIEFNTFEVLSRHLRALMKY